MNRCRLCVLPDSRPDTHFEDGICSACRSYAERPKIDWDARKQELLQLLDRHDGRVIVPSSGGKDSTYIALRLKELGADVTAVTATTCHLSGIGRANIDNLAKHVRTIEVTPNMKVRAKLNRLSFELVGDPSWPEHVSIHRTPFRIANQLGIPLLFYGECPNDQYGGPPGTEKTRIMTQRWASEFAGFLGLRASDFIGMEGITERDMQDYMAPNDGQLKQANITAYFLGAFEPWDSHRNAAVAKANGMLQLLPGRMNLWPHENQDNLQVSLHDHGMYRKFGYGRLAAQLSVDIRSNLYDRELAMKMVHERDGLFPYHYLNSDIETICDHIGMSVEQAIKLFDRFTNWDLFARVEDNRPILKEFNNV